MRQSPIITGVPTATRTVVVGEQVDRVEVPMSLAAPTGTLYTDPLLHDLMCDFWDACDKQKRPRWSAWFSDERSKR